MSCVAHEVKELVTGLEKRVAALEEQLLAERSKSAELEKKMSGICEHDDMHSNAIAALILEDMRSKKGMKKIAEGCNMMVDRMKEMDAVINKTIKKVFTVDKMNDYIINVLTSNCDDATPRAKEPPQDTDSAPKKEKKKSDPAIEQFLHSLTSAEKEKDTPCCVHGTKKEGHKGTVAFVFAPTIESDDESD